MSEHAGSSAAVTAPLSISYDRRRPESTTLYAVVRDNINTLYAAVEAGFTGAALPEFVRDELEGYLDCGLLCRGFALLRCGECGERRLVAFSCKGRGFCPSCSGRRMCQTAANLIDHVVPSGGVQQGPDGLVRIALKRAFSDGTIAIELDPLSLLCRLCASVPAPKLHTVRYAGVLAAHCKWRSLIIPAPPADAPPEHPNDDTPPPMRGRSMYRRILSHLGEQAEPRRERWLAAHLTSRPGPCDESRPSRQHCSSSRKTEDRDAPLGATSPLPATHSSARAWLWPSRPLVRYPRFGPHTPVFRVFVAAAPAPHPLQNDYAPP